MPTVIVYTQSLQEKLIGESNDSFYNRYNLSNDLGEFIEWLQERARAESITLNIIRSTKSAWGPYQAVANHPSAHRFIRDYGNEFWWWCGDRSVPE